MSATVISHPTLHEVPDQSGESGRALHFVGSLPPELLINDSTAMQWFVDQAGDTDLLTLPCDQDPQWIVNWLVSLADVAALQTVHTGDSTSYEDLPAYGLAPGHRLAPEDIALRRASDVTAAMAARNRLSSDRDLPPHQVSVPNALDLSFFCFGGPKAALAHLSVFREAVLTDIRHIHDRWGDDVVFQLETPAVLVMFDRTPRQLWPALSFGLAHKTAQLITGAPRSARWILHLCHGDLAHEPLVEPRDLVPAVQFLNALHRRLNRLDYPMPTAHIPMCTGITGPPTEPLFYRALQHLRTGIDIIAGLADELHPEDSRTALHLVESELGHRAIAVAAACGLGRRTTTAAEANAALARELSRIHTDQPSS
ncbi:hypothetical protein [Amycolatopsis anabasis]|uniref:hypothetical protein n=1 Tax=Amycolatopsis anabasis TaxID=1840409 RepID=UPI00131DEF22|nr:hypothetical protein [Amycolatopsis anabasis]